MDDIGAIAAWLRQRDGEADEAWIERLHVVFQADNQAGDDLRDAGKAERIGERLWWRYKASLQCKGDGSG